MRLIKMFGLAALAAVAAMAFVGAGSASADTLCLSNAGHEKECPVADREPIGTTVVGLATGALLLNGSGEVLEKCHSKTAGKVTSNLGAHKGLVALITELNFTNCEGICKKATGHAAPFEMLAFALQLHVLIKKHALTGLRPGARLEECFAGIQCLYQTVSQTPLLNIGTDTLIANKVALEESAPKQFLCPDSGAWDATYLLTVGEKPVFLTSLP